MIAAPMTGVSSPELTAAASRNGVIGSFPSHNATTIQELSSWLSWITVHLAQYSERTSSSTAPFAVNIVVHRSNQRLQADLEQVIHHGVELVITSVGNPADVVEPLHAAGRLIFADVATVHHAQRALDAGVDGLILLTAGAGGQTGWLNPFAFLSAVRDRYDGPIVLAGGIADGASLWAARTAGADLAYMGTKFIATSESVAPEAYKRAVIMAGPDEIELTTRLTGLGTNLLTRQPDIEGAAPEAPSLSFDHKALLRRGLAWSAGHSVTGVRELLNAQAVISQTHREYRDARTRTLELLARTGPGA